eukprot:2934761-Rhodomonas_salina.2
MAGIYLLPTNPIDSTHQDGTRVPGRTRVAGTSTVVAAHTSSSKSAILPTVTPIPTKLSPRYGYQEN